MHPQSSFSQRQISVYHYSSRFHMSSSKSLSHFYAQACCYVLNLINQFSQLQLFVFQEYKTHCRSYTFLIILKHKGTIAVLLKKAIALRLSPLIEAPKTTKLAILKFSYCFY